MLSFKTILFPTDFSRCSDQAFDYGTLLAEQFDAELHLLHALVLLNDDPANPDRQLPEEIALLDRLEKVTKSKLGELVNRDPVSILRVREARRRGYSASEVILDYAREVGADLIVMGTHGRRGPKRWFLGSVAEDVLRSAGCPVLTIHEREEGQTLAPIRRILVPVDLGASSAKALAFGKEIAQAYGAKLTLLHMVNLPAMSPVYGQPFRVDMGDIVARTRDELRQMAERAGLEEDDFDVAVDSGSPSAAIVDYAATNDVGMIVMPTRGGPRHELLGGTAAVVVRRATCPVMTVPPAAEAQDQEIALSA